MSSTLPPCQVSPDPRRDSVHLASRVLSPDPSPPFWGMDSIVSGVCQAPALGVWARVHARVSQMPGACVPVVQLTSRSQAPGRLANRSPRCLHGGQDPRIDSPQLEWAAGRDGPQARTLDLPVRGR